MPARCIAGNCGNVPSKKDNIKLHSFPEDEKIRAQWVKFVQLKRADFTSNSHKRPSLCSCHFTRDCFRLVSKFVRKKMPDGSVEYATEEVWEKKYDAVPSIVNPEKSLVPSGPPSASSVTGTPTVAKGNIEPYTIDERKRLVGEALQQYSLPSKLADDNQSTTSSQTLETSRPAGNEFESVVDTPQVDEQVLLSSFGVKSKSSVGRNLSRSKVHHEDIPPWYPTLKDRSCQTKREKAPEHRAVFTQCALIGHEFVNELPPSVIQATKSNPCPCPPPSPGDKQAKKRVSLDSLPSMSHSTPKKKREEEDVEPHLDLSMSFQDDEITDPTWTQDTSISGEMIDHDDIQKNDVDTVKFYVVQKRNLLELFKVCQHCFQRGAEAKVTHVNGTQVVISQFCLGCDETWKWKSQETVHDYPLGNISLSAALLCSGSVPSKALRMLEFWGVETMKPQTFCTHQRRFLNTAVRNIWEEEQIRKFSGLNDSVQLSGDARCDSMGHCAKYGSYTLHDKDTDAIICSELVVSTEPASKKSAAMEVLGLKRALDVVENYCPHIKIKLITDGHPGVAKHVKEDRAQNITHRLDIWHVSKGMKKRMAKLVKRFPQISQWKRSIVNHLYWCAVTSNDDGALIVAKWKSLANHIINRHVHENPLFPGCAHGKIGKKLWFDPASEAYDALCTKVILNKAVLRAVEKLSSDAQTSGLEGFHSTINQFAPKMYHFGYHAMQSRVQIAALHFNENSQRAQKTNSEGNLSYNVRYPKSRGGDYIVVPVKKDPSFDYAKKIQGEVLRLLESGRIYMIQEQQPAFLNAEFKRPESKEVAIQEHVTRFKDK